MAARGSLIAILLAFLITSRGSLQDAPVYPISVAIELVNPTKPMRVSDRPAGLKLTLMDSAGRPAPLSSIGLTAGTSDTKCCLNGFQVITANGSVLLENAVQFHTPGKHEITVSSKDGSIKGKLSNIQVDPLQPDIKIEMQTPKAVPKYVQSGTVLKLRSKLVSKDAPVSNKEVRIKATKGVRMSPSRVFTDDQGLFEATIITPVFCVHPGPGPGPGPIGTLEGENPMKLECFVDCDGNGKLDAQALEPSLVIDPIIITTPCPLDLLIAARVQLAILVSGGVIEPPFPGPGPIVTAIGTVPSPSPKPPKGKSDQQMLEAALNELEKLLANIDTGKWKGRFSDVVKDIENVNKFLSKVSVPSVTLVLENTKCAIEILKTNPDITDVRFDIQAGKQPAFIPIKTRTALSLELFSKDKKVTNPMLSHCTQPRAKTVTVDKGPGTIHSVSENPMKIDFECLGKGPVKVDSTINFEPESVIIIDTGEVIAASSSITGSGDFLTIRPFPYETTLKIVQQGTMRVTAVQFDHVKDFSVESMASDAITIVRDQAPTVLSYPEWKLEQGRANTPDESPACYLRTVQDPTVLVSAEISVSDGKGGTAGYNGKAVVRGKIDPVDGVLGNVEGELTFKNGVTDPERQPLKLTQHRFRAEGNGQGIVQRQDVKWKWSFELSINNASKSFDCNESNHRIYEILAPPILPPWREKKLKALPWVKALDVTCVVGKGAKTDVELATLLTTYLVTRNGLAYDVVAANKEWTAFLKRDKDPDPASRGVVRLFEFQIDLDQFLDTDKAEVSCFDMAGALYGLATVAGVDMRIVYYPDWGNIPFVYPVGRPVTNNPFYNHKDVFKFVRQTLTQTDPDSEKIRRIRPGDEPQPGFGGGRWRWGTHCYCRLQSGGKFLVFDATSRLDQDQNPDTEDPMVIAGIPEEDFLKVAKDRSHKDEQSALELPIKEVPKIVIDKRNR